jgi:hypothetical protein
LEVLFWQVPGPEREDRLHKVPDKLVSGFYRCVVLQVMPVGQVQALKQR